MSRGVTRFIHKYFMGQHYIVLCTVHSALSVSKANLRRSPPLPNGDGGPGGSVCATVLASWPKGCVFDFGSRQLILMRGSALSSTQQNYMSYSYLVQEDYLLKIIILIQTYHLKITTHHYRITLKNNWRVSPITRLPGTHHTTDCVVWYVLDALCDFVVWFLLFDCSWVKKKKERRVKILNLLVT